MSMAGRRFISFLLAIAIVFPPLFTAAMAEMITTDAVLAAEKRNALASDTETLILQEKVSAQFSRLGVDHDQIMDRIRAMTDDELAVLAREMDAMPAGAGAIEILGIIFLVLLILELVGVTDIFKKI